MTRSITFSNELVDFSLLPFREKAAVNGFTPSWSPLAHFYDVSHSFVITYLASMAAQKMSTSIPCIWKFLAVRAQDIQRLLSKEDEVTLSENRIRKERHENTVLFHNLHTRHLQRSPRIEIIFSKASRLFCSPVKPFLAHVYYAKV